MEFELPESLPTDLDGLKALRAQAVTAFNALRAKDSFSAEDREAVTKFKADIETLNAHIASVAELAALADSMVEDQPEAPKAPAASFAGLGGDAAPTTPAQPTAGWRIRPDAPAYSQEMGGLQTIKTVKQALGNGLGSIASPNGKVSGEYASQVVASYHRNLVDVNDYMSLDEALADAKTRVHQGENLFAAAWCAPSETDYNFCAVPPAVELFDIPEVSNKRGGLRWPIDPSYDGDLQVFCEPELADAVKECITIPCPEFEEIRLCALPLCLEVDLLQDAAWPELTAYYTDLVTQTNLRQRASWKLNAALTHADTGTLSIPAAGQLGAAASFLNSLTIGANRLRGQRNLSSMAVIEAVIPAWAKDLLRADIANQGGIPQYNVTDALISSWLSARHIAPQFIGHWQTLGASTDEYPPTIEVLLYETGAFFALAKPVVNLGVQYPRELVQVNTYSRFFVEDGLAVGKRCGGALRVTIPVCASGEIGERGSITCPATGSS